MLRTYLYGVDCEGDASPEWTCSNKGESRSEPPAMIGHSGQKATELQGANCVKTLPRGPLLTLWSSATDGNHLGDAHG
jgi:hypothetical protein